MAYNPIPKTSKVYVAGHNGLVGSAICRNLAKKGYKNVIGRTHAELDLLDQQAVRRFFAKERPEIVVLAAARVGGIHANNSRPAEFIRDNLLIQTSVIDAAWRHGARKLLFLGSSCIYPKLAPQPLREEYLLTGPLEPTNEWYAIAKIAGLKMCQAYRRQYGFDAISAMPTNLYGPGDNFDLQNSHVLPALMRKVHEAKLEGRDEIEVWGTGSAMREFLYVDDLADACLFLMEHYDDAGHVNIGTGLEVSIRELAETLIDVVHPTATIRWDSSRPDGAPRKLLDVSKLEGLGWRHTTGLREGIERTYRWLDDHYDSARGIERRATV